MSFLVFLPDRVCNPKVKAAPQDLGLLECQRKRLSKLAPDLYYVLLAREKKYAQRAPGFGGLYVTVFLGVPGATIKSILEYI